MRTLLLKRLYHYISADTICFGEKRIQTISAKRLHFDGNFEIINGQTEEKENTPVKDRDIQPGKVIYLEKLFYPEGPYLPYARTGKA